MKKSIIILSIFIALVSCKKETTTVVSDDANNGKVEIEFKKEGELSFIQNGEILKSIDIEIANTINERSEGLMHRSKMAENNGMLFLFEKVQPLNFYMRNTRIPLDIIYIDEDSTVINIAKNATPYKETGVPSSNKPGLFVVEINGGLADKWGIVEGETKIKWTTGINSESKPATSEIKTEDSEQIESKGSENTKKEQDA